MLEQTIFSDLPFPQILLQKGKSLPVPSGNHVILLSFLLFHAGSSEIHESLSQSESYLQKQAASPPQSPVEAEKIPFGSDRSSVDY